MLDLLDSGSHVIVMDDVYGGTYRLFERVRRRSAGLDFSFVDLNDMAALEAAVKPNTKLIWCETPTNPMLKIVDIARLAEFARKRGIWLAVDNTFSSPILQRPLELGAHLVMHSATKYLNGHSDIVGGMIVVGDDTELDLSGSVNLADQTLALQANGAANLAAAGTQPTAPAISTVSVMPVPQVSVSGPAALCSGSSGTFTATGASSYSWSTGATNSLVTITPSSSANYQVTGISSDGCSATHTFPVLVNPLPSVTVNGGAEVATQAEGRQTLTSNDLTALNTALAEATADRIAACALFPRPRIAYCRESSTHATAFWGHFSPCCRT